MRKLKDSRNPELTLKSAFEAGARLFPIDNDGNFQISDIDFLDTWEAMTKLLKTGKTKAVGVSNVTIVRLKALLARSSVIPAVNQVEAHPYLQQPELLEFCNEHNILLQAYSPLGNNVQGFTRCIDDPQIIEIAKKLGKEPAQVLISWAVQRGTCVLTKSVTEGRIRENYQDFILPDDVIQKIYAMDLKRRQNGQLHWGVDPFGEASEETVKKVAKARAAQNKVDFVD
jgi:diketogulonate reductase-like aldo/keto reductase